MQQKMKTKQNIYTTKVTMRIKNPNVMKILSFSFESCNFERKDTIYTGN